MTNKFHKKLIPNSSFLIYLISHISYLISLILLSLILNPHACFLLAARALRNRITSSKTPCTNWE